jgi:hypothetical protein
LFTALAILNSNAKLYNKSFFGRRDNQAHCHVDGVYCSDRASDAGCQGAGIGWMKEIPLLSRVTLRLLDTEKWWDYFILSFTCLIPSLIAVQLGIGDTFTVDGVTYIGWFDKYNFWPFFILLPLLLWLIRTGFARIANIVPEQVPENAPPLLLLFRDSPSPQYSYERLRNWLISPRLMGWTLFVSLCVLSADTSGLISLYLSAEPVHPGELDWSVMYLSGVVSKSANAWFCVAAYSIQALTGTLGLFAMAFLLAHNIYFLRSIYQRGRVEPGTEADYITLDLEDVSRCFGFRVANASFNTQVIAHCIGGFFILLSRFSNVGAAEGSVSWDDLVSGQAQFSLFPDVGQFILALVWTVALLIIMLPALVKLIPLLPGLGKLKELSVDGYLREYLPDEQWPYGNSPAERQINSITAKFANNAFWPTGDNRASYLLFFSFWVLLVIFYPIKTDDMLVFIPSMIFLGLIAALMRRAFFGFLNGSLSYVDKRLTTERPGVLDGEAAAKERISGSVFINYRREDSLAHARLLRQSLLEYIDSDHLFMDISTIEDGQDFVAEIESAISACDAVVVVIGPGWGRCVDSLGKRRIDKKDDFVRLEIAAAFAAGKTVIPVLVGGALMPVEADLPAEIVPLWRRHARELSDTRWEYDTGELAKALAKNT